MFDLMSVFAVDILAAGDGLNGLWETLLDNWVGPAFLAAIAFMAFGFLKGGQFRQLAVFVGVAVVVSLLVFAGGQFFGKKGKLTTTATDIAKDINTVLIIPR